MLFTLLLCPVVRWDYPVKSVAGVEDFEMLVASVGGEAPGAYRVALSPIRPEQRTRYVVDGLQPSQSYQVGPACPMCVVVLHAAHHVPRAGFGAHS